MPVTAAEYQPICFSRACRPRTARPLDPDLISAGPATRTLCRSARLGVRVIATSLDQVRWSTSPVTVNFRLPWKPLTPLVVVRAYVPVIDPAYHSSWRSRCCSSRTFSPLSPFASSAAGRVVVGVGSGFGLGSG